MKRRKKRAQPPSLRSDPTDERLRHANGHYDTGDDKQGTVRITMRDAPLERLRSAGVIDPEQYGAGCVFRQHWYQGGLEGLASADLLRVNGGTVNFDLLSKTEGMEHHRRQFFIALQHLGRVNARVLGEVVCYEVPLHVVGVALGWNTANQARAAATERLRDGLDRLVELWT